MVLSLFLFLNRVFDILLSTNGPGEILQFFFKIGKIDNIMTIVIFFFHHNIILTKIAHIYWLTSICNYNLNNINETDIN